MGDVINFRKARKIAERSLHGVAQRSIGYATVAPRPNAIFSLRATPKPITISINTGSTREMSDEVAGY
jgi:hypothetical protein